jgi:hypothetical protein
MPCVIDNRSYQSSELQVIVIAMQCFSCILLLCVAITYYHGEIVHRGIFYDVMILLFCEV